MGLSRWWVTDMRHAPLLAAKQAGGDANMQVVSWPLLLAQQRPRLDSIVSNIIDRFKLFIESSRDRFEAISAIERPGQVASNERFAKNRRVRPQVSGGEIASNLSMGRLPRWVR